MAQFVGQNTAHNSSSPPRARPHEAFPCAAHVPQEVGDTCALFLQTRVPQDRCEVTGRKSHTQRGMGPGSGPKHSPAPDPILCYTVNQIHVPKIIN